MTIFLAFFLKTSSGTYECDARSSVRFRKIQRKAVFLYIHNTYVRKRDCEEEIKSARKQFVVH